MVEVNLNAGNPIRNLNTDFGDAPLVRLGKRHVQAQNPVNPRHAANAPASNPVVRFFSRLLDAMTPHSMRSESKFRHGLEDTSKTVGAMLGAIADGNTPALQKLLGQVGRDAEPVTSRGHGLPEVLSARVRVHINKLDQTQIVALVLGLAKIKVEDPSLELIAQTIKSVAKDRILSEAIDVVVGNIRQQSQNAQPRPDRMTGVSGLLDGPATAIASQMKSSGLWGEGGMDRAALQLLKAGLAEVSKEQRQGFLARLSLSELMALQAAPDHLVGDDARLELAQDIAEAVEQETSVRKIALYGKVELLAKTAPRLANDPKALVRALAVIDRDWADFQSLGIKDEGISEALESLGDALAELRFDAVSVKTMTNRELNQLWKLMTVHATGPDLDILDREVAARGRLHNLISPVATDLKLAVNYLVDGEPKGFGSALQRMAGNFPTAFADFCLEKRLEDGVETRSAFMKTLTDAAFGVDGMTQETLQKLDGVFRSEPCLSFLGWLEVVGNDETLGQTPIGREAAAVFELLDALRRNISARVNPEVPPYPFVRGDVRAEPSRDLALALGRFGIKIQEGKPTLPSISLRSPNDEEKCEQMRLEIAEVLKGGGGKMDETFKVAKQFAADVTRNGKSFGNYLMDFGDGPEEMVPESEKMNGSRQILNVVEKRLLALFDNDETMVASVTKFMHQGNFANLLQSVMFAEQSPVKDGKGEPVIFIGAREELKMLSVARNSDGSAELRLLFDLAPMFVVKSDDNEIKEIACDTSSNLVWDITARVLPDGITFEVPQFSHRHNIF